MRTIREMEAGTLKRIPQDESRMTYDPMLNKGMGVADFTADADRVRGQINGLNPWPCVSVPIGSERLKLLRAVRTEDSGKPGSVIASDSKSGLIIACGSGAVRILEIQAPGGKKMKPEDYLRGHSLPAGTDLKEDRT